MATLTRVFIRFWSLSIEDALFKCLNFNCLERLLFLVIMTMKMNFMIQMFIRFRAWEQWNIIESPYFIEIVTPMTYFNCLSDITCQQYIDNSFVVLCAGLHICGALLWCVDQQSGADLWWLSHAVWLLCFGSGVVCRPHDQMESNKDIFLWVK